MGSTYYLPIHHQEKPENLEDNLIPASTSRSSLLESIRSSRTAWWCSPWLSWSIILILTLTNIVNWAKMDHRLPKLPKDAVFSPLASVIKYKNVLTTSGVQDDISPYQGVPNEENDRLWEELYNFRVSKIPMSDAAQMTNKTVPLANEPGQYVATLYIFHQLHCLNMIRHAIYKSEAIPAEGVTEDGLTLYHLDHCIDSLRQSMMCASDVTPIPFAWYTDYQSYETYSGIMRTCRDYEAIQDWARENEIKPGFDKKIHTDDPLGNVYMDHEGHITVEEPY